MRGVQTRTLIAYIGARGFCATLPFLVLPDIYTGPAARALGGVDVGWLVGLIVAGGAYLLLCRSLDVTRESDAVRASESELRSLTDSRSVR